MTGTGFAALAALSLLSGLIYLMVGGNIPLVPGVVILIMLLGGIVAGSLLVYSESLKRPSQVAVREAHRPWLSGRRRRCRLTKFILDRSA